MYSLILVPLVSAFYYSLVANEEPIVVQSVATTEEPLVVQEFTTDCVDFTTEEPLVVQEFTVDCSSETVSVYTEDIFVLNSVEQNSIEPSSKTCYEYTTTVTVTSTVLSENAGVLGGLSTTTTDIMSITLLIVGDLEGLSTTDIVSSTLLFAGDLEGLPTPVINETLPEISIEEIGNIEVSQIRDNGLEFCNAVGLGDVVSNGTQQQFQTCSLTVQGAIPAIDKMVSTIIVNPENNAVITLGTNLTITIKSLNIEYGFFDDPSTLYYISPQRLNSEGIIQGHNHVAIQKLLGLGEVPSAQNPLFFKGLNEVSLDGTLSTVVDGALFTEPGEYRLCTSSASQGHQPVLSPVARRFFQDDCIRFTVVN